jgi:hypothetical protein
MNASVSKSKKLSRNLLFFSALLAVLLISVWARAESVILAWDSNTEADLAGYRIYYGTAGGNYTAMIDVGNVITCTVSNLSAGQTYYFAATAYDASGNENGYSNEVIHTIPAPNGSPTTPSNPSGTSSGMVNTIYPFSTGATDPNGHTLQYRYDWGAEFCRVGARPLGPTVGCRPGSIA